ncbi:MAG: addiction module protein [Candidatus Competibacteraceae bacterium]|nr:addiction module protein [Candidatus Competibacteraceae bacterium]
MNEQLDNLANDDQKPELSEAQQLELNKRLLSLEHDGNLGESWASVKCRIIKQLP